MTDPYLTEQEVADMSRMIKNARAVTIAGDGHFLASRNQDDLAEKLLPFLMDGPHGTSGKETSLRPKKYLLLANTDMAKNIGPSKQGKIRKTRITKKSSGKSSVGQHPKKSRTSIRSAMKLPTAKPAENRGIQAVPMPIARPYGRINAKTEILHPPRRSEKQQHAGLSSSLRQDTGNSPKME
jgi:hypothetical protein